MRGLKRVFIAIPITLILAILITGISVVSEMTERREALDTYIRIATKDAIVNVQTTEQEGLNFTSKNTNQQIGDYDKYLIELDGQLPDGASDDTMQMLREFLVNNNKNKKDGDELFRPIQFGMTYLDKSLFEESFKDSLLTLVKANHNINSNSDYKLMCNDSLHVYDEQIRFVYDGPKVVQYLDEKNSVATDSDTKQFLRQLYGADNAALAIEQYNAGLDSNSANLGISMTTVPTFYVYYDIDIYVPWGSSTAIQILSQNFLEKNLHLNNLEFNDASGNTADEQRFIRWSNFKIVDDLVDPASADGGTVQHYSYRYVLLN